MVLPAVNDYANYADMTGFRSRENYHYKLFSAANLGEYVAVFNNDVYLQEEATFTITVRMQLLPRVLAGDSPVAVPRELQLSKG